MRPRVRASTYHTPPRVSLLSWLPMTPGSPAELEAAAGTLERRSQRQPLVRRCRVRAPPLRSSRRAFLGVALARPPSWPVAAVASHRESHGRPCPRTFFDLSPLFRRAVAAVTPCSRYRRPATTGATDRGPDPARRPIRGRPMGWQRRVPRSAPSSGPSRTIQKARRTAGGVEGMD